MSANSKPSRTETKGSQILANRTESLFDGSEGEDDADDDAVESGDNDDEQEMFMNDAQQQGPGRRRAGDLFASARPLVSHCLCHLTTTMTTMMMI